MVIKVIDDKEKQNFIRQKIKENDGYCPCKIDKIPQNKCMCQQFLNSEELGPCHCGLYIKQEK